MCNSGGGIFRFVNSTSELPELEKNFAAATTVRLPLKNIAEAFGFAFYSADSEHSLRKIFPEFIGRSDAPAILAIDTPADTDAEVLKNYFNRSEILKNINHV